MSAAPAVTPTIRRQFTMLIYPFRHDIDGEQRSSRLKRLDARWRPWWSRLDRDALQRTLDDTYFFLPYIRRLLFPETALLNPVDPLQQVTQAAELANRRADELAKRLSSAGVLPDGVLRLTCVPEHLAALQPLALECAHHNGGGAGGETFAMPARIHWVDVVLFPQQVGFLALKVALGGEHLPVDRLNDFLYYARFVHAPTVDWQLASWRRTMAEAPLAFGGRDLIDFLLQGFTEGFEDLDPSIDAFIGRLREDRASQRYSTTSDGQVYGQVFRQYTYACLDESAEAAPTAAPTTHAPTAACEGSPALFTSAAERVLYELTTCTDTADPDYEPHPAGLAQLRDRGLIALWANWQAMALHDNVVFLTTRPSRFTEHGLARNVENDYFHVYLLTLYQKMRLSLLAGELMRQGAKLHRNLREARTLSTAFVMFRNHYWFAQITFKPQGMEIYRRFQQGLEVRSLYEAISQEVRGLQEHYEGKAQRRIRTLLDVLAVIGLPTVLLNGLFTFDLVTAREAGVSPARFEGFQFHWDLWLQFAPYAIGMYGLTFLIWWVWQRVGRD